MAEPKIRFRRDDGSDYPSWEQGRFGDLIEVYDEKVTSDCTLPVLTSSKTDGIQYQSDHFGREQLHDITGYNVIPRGYCTYRNRSDGTDFTFNINNLCDKGIVSKFYPVFHATDRCNLYFLMTLMNNEPKTVRKIAMTAKGTGQKVLSFLDLQKIDINIPALEEQQKIAYFLSSVDEVITASEEEVANLEKQKRAVMKKIFSQEVRFKRADGSEFPEWEEKPLGNIAGVYDGTHQTPEYVAEGIKFVSVENISDLYGTNKYITEDAFMKQYKNNAPQKGDVLMTRIGDIGTAALVSSDEQLAYYVSLALLKPSSVILPNYLVQAIASDFFQSELWIRTLHTAYPKKINKEDIGKCLIQIPCLEEQRLIADFLSDFDEAIAAATKELELWKELKKGLLQKMFV